MHDREELKRQLDAALGRESEAIIARRVAEERIREFDRSARQAELDAAGIKEGDEVVAYLRDWNGNIVRQSITYALCGIRPDGEGFVIAKIKKDGTAAVAGRGVPWGRVVKVEKAQ